MYTIHCTSACISSMCRMSIRASPVSTLSLLSYIDLYCTDTVLLCALLYCYVLYCTVMYCIVLLCTVLYCYVLYCTVMCFIVLLCTVLYFYVLYCTVTCFIVLLCTVLMYASYPAVLLTVRISAVVLYSSRLYIVPHTSDLFN